MGVGGVLRMAKNGRRLLDMKHQFLVLTLSSLLFTACSSPEPELSYDPVELVEYENCLNNPPEGTESNWAEIAEIVCKDKKPTLK